jgi:hypothetical protein
MSGYYKTGDGLGLGRLGQAADSLAPGEQVRNLGYQDRWAMQSPTRKVMAVAGLAAVPALAYHGYKRNDSVGWALVWGLFGSMVWPITVPVAVAQGFGKKKTNKNPRRRRRTSRKKRRTSRARRR